MSVLEIISVGAPQTIPTSGGKSYQSIEVAYKRDGKIEGKKLMSFSNPIVFKSIQSFKPGDNIDVESYKDDKGYWQWKHVKLATGAPETSGNTLTTSSVSTKTVSNYETREERQARQVYIVRQSSIGHAIELLSSNGGKKSTVEDVIAIASQFEDYVFSGTEASQELAEDIPQ